EGVSPSRGTLRSLILLRLPLRLTKLRTPVATHRRPSQVEKLNADRTYPIQKLVDVPSGNASPSPADARLALLIQLVQMAETAGHHIQQQRQSPVISHVHQKACRHRFGDGAHSREH